MITPRRKIAYISGTRADFGLMTPVLKAIAKSKKLSLQVYATGMHLMPEFGATGEMVTQEFPSVRIIDAPLRGNIPTSIAQFVSEVIAKTTTAFEKETPDLVLLLGDRPEMLAVATTCLYLGIPTAHLHGGERTGTADEVTRHAITKLVSLHFPATEDSAERIKKMGEDEWRIHIVGAPALDVITGGTLPSKDEVAAFIHFPDSEKFILLLQHPSERWEVAGKEMEETIAALKEIALPVVAVYPNADVGSSNMIEVLERERHNPLFRIFKNIPYEMFLAIEREASVWVGNSSAALIESASFKTPVVTIGERQKGRLCGGNVIRVSNDIASIAAAITKSLYDNEYRRALQTIVNPWGDGKTATRVREVLENLDAPVKLLAKQIAY